MAKETKKTKTPAAKKKTAAKGKTDKPADKKAKASADKKKTPAKPATKASNAAKKADKPSTKKAAAKTKNNKSGAATAKKSIEIKTSKIKDPDKLVKNIKGNMITTPNGTFIMNTPENRAALKKAGVQ